MRKVSKNIPLGHQLQPTLVKYPCPGWVLDGLFVVELVEEERSFKVSGKSRSYMAICTLEIKISSLPVFSEIMLKENLTGRRRYW